MTLVTDPFANSFGLTPPRGQADIVVISRDAETAYNNRAAVGDEKTFVIDGPGEYDVKGLFVHGLPTENNSTIYAVRMENIRLGFLGALKEKELSDQQLQDLDEVDILFVPVGGKNVCDAEQAVTIINQVEPSLVVPMHFAQSGLKIPLDKIEVFLKEIGSKAEAQDKLTVKKSELLPNGVKVIVLSPQR